MATNNYFVHVNFEYRSWLSQRYKSRVKLSQVNKAAVVKDVDIDFKTK